MEQLSLFDACEFTIEKSVEIKKNIKLLTLDEYDHILISESGGKDSMACLFYL
ncbi:hypothetical protein [Cytobacillus purgationiresistens]|uniref:tRNA(Ile)-lysidine synthase TilS/MesJ n=1 Tax=Cytobacillus purgationiresistens TaxID=863449 RepID=A0ABU0AQR7_9BACI|nr:hypothetical protein [Cytobacillus purgationiresistens]MDQ0273375.1 tRNA(Ile)-lysidine synthase TilS/MesJ [Cytobacillus purgationiresistens]